MKIILVNYRYFISGGPERYYFNIKEMKRSLDHWKTFSWTVKSLVSN